LKNVCESESETGNEGDLNCTLINSVLWLGRKIVSVYLSERERCERVRKAQDHKASNICVHNICQNFVALGIKT
jgi:hypothetical protein